jgi:primase-polymerase (primpol)-like protein
MTAVQSARPVVTYRAGWTDRIPEEPKGRRQWVCWAYRWRGKKWTKVPYQANLDRGRRPEASTTDPSTWSSFTEVLAAFQADDELAGIGYVFSTADELCGVDFDNCVAQGGELLEWASQRLEALGSTYCEVSPSGRDIKAFYRAAPLPIKRYNPKTGKPSTGRRRGGYGPDGLGEIEIYDRDRFFTVTGDRWWDDHPEIAPADPGGLALLVAEVDGPSGRGKPGENGRPRAAGKGTKPRKEVDPAAKALLDALGDDELLERARGAENGSKFARLFDDGDTSAHGDDDSRADCALLTMLAFWTGADAARMETLFGRSALAERDKWADRPDYRDQTITAAIALNAGDCADLRPGGGASSSERAGKADDQADEQPGARPAIEVNTERHRVLAETLAVLPLDPALFTRGDVLVRINHETEENVRLAGGVELRQAAGSARVVMLAEAGLGCRLTALADFVAWSIDRSGEWVCKPAHPPPWLMKAVLENGSYPGVRPLRGLAEVPFPRPDGSLVVAPGYDPATAVFHAPTVALDPLPERPDQAAAQAAAQALLELVEQFPFASDDDKAVWLAALLTVLARPGIAGPVPGIALVANRAGTGKGKLIDVVGILATGKPVPCTTYPKDDEETRKVKIALALAATQIVHLDNLDEGSLYGCGPLDSAVTSLEVNDRITGTAKITGGIELRPAWFLSGNNVAPGKDAFRRWLVCNLLTELERPEERNDLVIPDLLAHVRTHRAELVRAGLIILQAHAAAGRPTGGWAPLGSFEEWDRGVRAATWYATGWDCNATRRQAADEAPERLNRLALLEAWRTLPGGGEGGHGVTAAEARRLAELKVEPADSRTTPEPRHPALVDALERFGRDGKLPSPRSIDNTISALSRQNIDGWAFRKVGERLRSSLWTVCQVRPNTQNTRKEGQKLPNAYESDESDESGPGSAHAILHSYPDVMMSSKDVKNDIGRLGADSSDSYGRERGEL